MTPKGSTLKFAVALAALLAVIMIMIAGVRWMTAMGNQGQLDSAKTMISNSLIGLILALGSYTILYSINPALVSLKMPQVAMIRTEPLKMEEGESDWGNITFCRRDCNNYGGPLATIFCACGVKYKNCVGIMTRAEELSEKICIAVNKDKKIVETKKVSLINISNFQKYKGEKSIKAVSEDYNCGWVYMKNNKLFLGKSVMLIIKIVCFFRKKNL